MIKKLKIGLLIAVLALFGMAGNVSAAALTWSADQYIDLSSPDINFVIVSGSKATSLVAGTGTIQVVVASGDVFTVTSADRDIEVSGVTTAETSIDCSGSLATLIITGGSGGETITVTPSATQCGGGGGGGGGGGSSGNNNNDNAAEPATPANQETPAGCLPGYQFSPLTGRNCNAATPAVPAGCGLGNAFSGLTGQSCGLGNAGNPSPNNGNNGNVNNNGNHYAFGTFLVKQGSKGEACKAWQMFFNDKAGAHLVLDGNCGPLTMAAAKKWQASAGLEADGLLGPKSRAKANAQAGM